MLNQGCWFSLLSLLLSRAIFDDNNKGMAINISRLRVSRVKQQWWGWQQRGPTGVCVCFWPPVTNGLL
jgi:hypothetical protein